MTFRSASLPMYDADREAVAEWWRVLVTHFEAEGMASVPPTLAWPDDLNAHWHDPSLLLSQTCGYPLVTHLRDVVQVVGAFRYDVPGCSGIDYRSELIVRSDEPGRRLADFAGRVVVVNEPTSQSGCNVLRTMVEPLAREGDFFGDWRVSGAHRRSIEMVRSGRADIAAVDCITLAGLTRQRPDLLDGLRTIGPTIASPGLPLVTGAATTPAELAALRHAIQSACDDPTSSAPRARLFIHGFEAVGAEAWRSIQVDTRLAGLPA